MRLALCLERVDPRRGGAETYVADLCGYLVRAGHEVDLYAHSWQAGVLPAEVRCRLVEAAGWTRSGRIWSFAKNAEAAMRAVAAYDCTVGFINTWHQDVLVPQGGVHAASREANSRRFARGWQRSLYRAAKCATPRALVYQWIEQRQYDPARSTRVVAVSEMVRGHLERFHRVPRERIRVIPNAIDAQRLAVDDARARRARVRDRYGLRPDDLVALFVGHNFRLKGLYPLLEALALGRRRNLSARPIHLLVCGGGKLGPVRRWVDELGLADTIHLAGFMADVRDAYHAADFFVSPTYYDPCSLVVFEALACGLPVITTACNGAGELITAGDEGFVVSAPDALGELADDLEKMTNDEQRRVMSMKARQLGAAQSFDSHVARLLELFRDVAESKRAGTGVPHLRSMNVAATH
jgi:UDP-glucose:(heptosyl)LPS alpha-1,3-glucosyltransferase